MTDCDNTPPEQVQKKSFLCKKWIDGECQYKSRHLWSECPSNQYSKNKGKKIDEKGELMLCTVEEFVEEMTYNDEYLDTANAI